MTHLDLFSGIGGFAIATERVWHNIEHTFCEIDPFCQTILKKHWPTSKIYGDIRTLTNSTPINDGRHQETKAKRQESEFRNRSVNEVFLLTGGFPCQPFSQAGRRKGTGDDRHLWPEMRRVIQEFSPRYVVAENVRGLLSIDGGMVFEQVCFDLEALGYEVQPFVVPACAVNAPHRRDRVWIVAHAKSLRAYGKPRKIRGENGRQDDECLSDTLQSDSGTVADAPSLNVVCGRRSPAGHDRESDRERTDEGRNAWDENWPQAATRLCSLDDGLPNGLVRPRGWRNAALKAAGNAIVPQIAEQIFRVIKNYEHPSRP